MIILKLLDFFLRSKPKTTLTEMSPFQKQIALLAFRQEKNYFDPHLPQ